MYIFINLNKNNIHTNHDNTLKYKVEIELTTYETESTVKHGCQQREVCTKRINCRFKYT